MSEDIIEKLERIKLKMEKEHIKKILDNLKIKNEDYLKDVKIEDIEKMIENFPNSAKSLYGEKYGFLKRNILLTAYINKNINFKEVKYIDTIELTKGDNVFYNFYLGENELNIIYLDKEFKIYGNKINYKEITKITLTEIFYGNKKFEILAKNLNHKDLMKINKIYNKINNLTIEKRIIF